MLGRIIDWALALAMAALTVALAVITYAATQSETWQIWPVIGLMCAICLGCLVTYVHDLVRPKRW